MKLVKILALSVLFATGMVTNSFAGSSHFAGPYIGITGSALGAAIDGTHTETDGAGGQSNSTKGTAGAIGATAGAELGYNFPVTDVVFISVNASYSPLDADFKADDAMDTDDVTVTLEDIMAFSIEPSFSMSDNTAFFLKAGVSEFSLNASGTGLDAAQSKDLSGETVAMGTKTITDSGIYMKTEVGMTSWDSFTLVNVGTQDGTVQADVDAAYGKIMIGKKF